MFLTSLLCRKDSIDYYVIMAVIILRMRNQCILRPYYNGPGNEANALLCQRTRLHLFFLT